jgi:hypothetical protein
VNPIFKPIYSGYPVDERIVLLSVSPGMVGREGRAMPMPRSYDYPWRETWVVMRDQTVWQVLNNCYGVQNISSIWLIGPDGKVIGRDMTADAVRAAVTSALGAPAATTAPSTWPTAP